MSDLKNKKIVYVGLSGGVDSSVSAALLQRAGFDVRGVFIKVWQPDFWGGCTMIEDRLDAMRVCAKLNLPFYTLDLEKEYKKDVVDYMIAEYKSGRTPNPDVMCNKYVKFGGFFDWAMKRGADYVATGHYARIAQVESKKSKVEIKSGPLFYRLLVGRDNNKDQSYFLWTLTQKQLSKTLFPVGDIEKPNVRKLAKKFNLPTAIKKDSQGLCFIGKVDMADFLKVFMSKKTGNVLNDKNEIIGNHDGVSFYTLGQRHGFRITKKTNMDSRYFIVSKDLANNTITVSDSQIVNVGESSRTIRLRDVNWTVGDMTNFEKEYSARIRYRQPLEKCNVHKDLQGNFLVKFKSVQKSPTPGQSVVIYDGEICLGGGIIM